MVKDRHDPEHQLTIKVPASVMKALRLRAASRGETIRATILRALAKDGLRVPPTELLDRRSTRSR
jgi:hypothetical protein